MCAHARDPPAFTTKGHEGTRSHAAEVLPRRDTKEHEAMRRRLYHEGTRRNTKPCGGGFTTKGHEGTRSHAAEALPRRGTKGHEAMRRRLQRGCLVSPDFPAVDSTMPHYIFREGPRIHAATHFAARLRVPSCPFVVNLHPQGFVLLRASSW